MFVKNSVPEVENESLSPDANRSQEEAELYNVQLSSDEDLDVEQEDEKESVEVMEPLEKSRAEKIKRSSLKKVDSLKKAFSRENFEKKMNKIVSVEKREKIKKSLSQNTKNKGGSFKIFHSKKNREEGEKQAEHETFSEFHADLAPAQEGDAKAEELAKEKMEGAKEKEEVEEEEKEEVEKKEVSLDDGAENELSITEGLRSEYTLSATLPQKTSHNALHEEEEEEEEEGWRENEEDNECEEKSTAVENKS